jgi:tRNA(fMet)-specific endonuclease VapC
VKRLLDTNAYVALKRGEARVADLVRRSEQLVFSVIVAGELLFGFRNGRRYEANLAELEAFLAHPAVLFAELTWTSADRFGLLSRALRRAGTPIPTNDVWIAAQAMETGAEVITFDRHFGAIANLAVTILEPS